jgi:hypothetical protein
VTRTTLALAAIALVAGIVGVNSQGPLFEPGSPVMVGLGSGEVALVDINRDGHLDLVTKHLLKQRVDVHVGDGRGRFVTLAGGPAGLGFEPGAVALGDVNGDGLVDLVVASRDSRSEYIQVFPGDGKGRFELSAGRRYMTSGSGEFYKPSIWLGDVNEDGSLDIMSANGRRNSIEILFGDGQGAFTAGPTVQLHAGLDSYSFAVGDIDHDGHLDLVTAGSGPPGSARLALELGDGTGRFRDAAGAPSVPAGPRISALADLNGDQRADLVLSHAEQGILTVLLNTGKGGFVPAARSPYDIGKEAFAVVTADVNRDQRIDILAATVTTVTVLLGEGGAFGPAPGSPFRAGPGAYHLAVGDIDEDGKLDLVASSFGGDSVAVLVAR